MGAGSVAECLLWVAGLCPALSLRSDEDLERPFGRILLLTLRSKGTERTWIYFSRFGLVFAERGSLRLFVDGRSWRFVLFWSASVCVRCRSPQCSVDAVRKTLR